VIFVCPKCLVAVEVRVESDADKVFLGKLGEHPKCPDDGGEMFRHETFGKHVRNHPRRYRLEELTAEELWRAGAGFGWPVEQRFAELAGDFLHPGAIIEEAVVETNGTGKPVIKSIRLQGGIELHLAAGGGGATVYKVVQHGR
jgi:hypothetical protein